MSGEEPLKKRGRGRPRSTKDTCMSGEEPLKKRGRGRPRGSTKANSAVTKLKIQLTDCVPRSLSRERSDSSPALSEPSTAPASMSSTTEPSYTNSGRQKRTATEMVKSQSSSQLAEEQRSLLSSRRAASRSTMRQFLTGAGMVAPGASRSVFNPGYSRLLSKSVSRRSVIYKSRKPQKSSDQRATIVTKEVLYHQGVRFSVGDVVSVRDADTEKTYFAQISGLLVDQFCGQFAALIWLVPTESALDPHVFDAASFVPAIVDQTKYDLHCLNFVSHRPNLVSYAATRT